MEVEMEQPLKGKIALVTGASGGIGAAIARRLTSAGASVALHYHGRREAAERLADELRAVSPDVMVIGAELRDGAQVRAMVDDVAARHGRLDILINNAGRYEPHPIELDFDAWQDVWRRTIELNLLGPANACWAAVRHMGEGARIVNIGSRGAFRGEPTAPAYGASKAGLHQLTQSLAVALAPRGISVFAVAPGFVETAMARPHLQGAAGDVVRAQSPFGRVATVGDVAYWVTCACMPDAAFASGAIFDVNGASYLRT
jgi:NAD(P)-dependent dehydrogenase (short-subunit alcohol dehydrogenase family)